MKIAFLAGHLSRRASGVREVVEQLSTELAERGNDIRVFGLEDAAWIEGDAELWSGPPATVARLIGPRAIGFAPGLWSALDQFAPDIVHLHGLWMANSALAARWASRSGKPLVVSPHGMLSDVALSYSRVRKRLASMLYQNRCLSLATMFHATCPQEKREIENYGLKQPVAEVPIGVRDIPKSLWGALPKREKVVVTVGRLHRKKGLERLLHAWKRLEERFPEWRLDVVGPDSGDGYGERLATLAAKLGLSRARIKGPAFGEEKWNKLLQSEIFVLPTESENFALTVPEALLAELAVISTDGAPWQALERNGFGWYVSRREAALAEGLSAAMSLPTEDRRRKGAAGRAWALERFDWGVVAGQFEASYTHAIRLNRQS